MHSDEVFHISDFTRFRILLKLETSPDQSRLINEIPLLHFRSEATALMNAPSHSNIESSKGRRGFIHFHIHCGRT